MQNWAILSLDLLKWVAHDRNKKILESHFNAEEAIQIGLDNINELERKRLDSLFYFAYDIQAEIQSVYRKTWEAQRKALIEILETFRSNFIEVYIYKGAEHIEKRFGSENLFGIADIDLIVNRNDLPQAKICMINRGYRNAVCDIDKCELYDVDALDVASAEMNHGSEIYSFSILKEFELNAREVKGVKRWQKLPQFLHNGKGYAIVIFDIHYNVGSNYDIDSILGRSIKSVFEGANTLSDEDHFWVTSVKYYNEISKEGSCRLRDYAYLASLLLNEKFDWTIVLESCREYELHAPLYYITSFLHYLNPDIMPVKVIERLNPMGVKRTNDYGWQIGKLLEFVEPNPLSSIELKGSGL